MMLIQRKRINSVLLIFILLFSCTGEQKNRIKSKKAFYHWVSKVDQDEETIIFLKENNFSRMYLHMFDVVWSRDNGPVPVAIASGEISDIPEIVPVVYITNEVFSKIDSSGIDTLASLIYSKISRQLLQLRSDAKISEYQIDCDWTESTRTNYFNFLKAFRKHIKDLTLSATIRLYPYKYRTKMGIPPVDRGMLMYYNMGQLISADEHNSILNNELGKLYLNVIEYPKPLDVAIPVFNWSVLFRHDEFQGLIKSVEPDEWSKLTFAEKWGYNQYQITTDTVYRDVYYRFGDIVRVESVQKQDISIAIDYLETLLGTSNNYITIYHIHNINKGNEDILNFIIKYLNK